MILIIITIIALVRIDFKVYMKVYIKESIIIVVIIIEITIIPMEKSNWV